MSKVTINDDGSVHVEDDQGRTQTIHAEKQDEGLTVSKVLKDYVAPATTILAACAIMYCCNKWDDLSDYWV